MCRGKIKNESVGLYQYLCSRDYAGQIMPKMITNTITQKRDKATNEHKIKENLKGESKINNRSKMKIERE